MCCAFRMRDGDISSCICPVRQGASNSIWSYGVCNTSSWAFPTSVSNAISHEWLDLTCHIDLHRVFHYTYTMTFSLHVHIYNLIEIWSCSISLLDFFFLTNCTECVCVLSKCNMRSLFTYKQQYVRKKKKTCSGGLQRRYSYWSHPFYKTLGVLLL